jgi:ribosome-associated toxin RatA of RatAB toxin-antitoxin module
MPHQRIIAAADVPAGGAATQVYPPPAGGFAFDATGATWRNRRINRFTHGCEPKPPCGTRVQTLPTNYGHAMATKDSREVVIEASPEEILAVITDVESTPTWSPQYQSAEVLEAYDDGRPHKVKMTIKAAGLTDEQTVEYTYGDNVVSWTLLKASQLRSQEGKYTLTPDGDTTKLRFDLSIELAVPLPGFVVKRVIKGAVETATDGLRKQVLKVQKGG